MKSLNGYLRKILSSFPSIRVFSQIAHKAAISGSLVVVFLSILFPAFSRNTYAADIRSTNEIRYTVNKDGTLEGEIITTLENFGNDTLVTFATQEIPFKDPKEVQATMDGQNILSSTFQNTTSFDAIVKLNERSIRSGQKISFSVFFKIPNILKQDQKQLTLPIATSDLTTTRARLNIIGQNVIFMTQTGNRNGDELTFENIKTQTLTLFLGEEISYRFTIDKVFKNPDTIEKSFDITLPSQIGGQLITLDSVSPAPFQTVQDAYGNLRVRYILKAGESLDVRINGTISYDYPNNERKGISDEKFEVWELASEYKKFLVIDAATTPPTEIVKKINRYVKDFFDHTKLSKFSERVGANTFKPANQRELVAIEDYSDLTIAMLREYNIPSRMVAGYVYDLNGKGSEKYFAHTWVEYYDERAGWQTLDPAYEDIFSRDLMTPNFDHIKFLVRVDDPESPKLTELTQQEIKFVIENQTSKQFLDANIELKLNDADEYVKGVSGYLTVTNRGNIPIESVNIDDPRFEVYSFATDEIIAPGQSTTIPVRYIAAQNNGENLSVNISSSRYERTLTASPQIQSKSYWWSRHLVKVASLLSFAIFAAIIYYTYRWSRRYTTHR